MAKRIFQGLILFFALYAFVFMPLGKKSALEHIRAILGTPAALEAASEVKGGVSRLVKRLESEARKSTEDRDRRLESLEDDVLRRRARHVVTEQERVAAAVSALEAGDYMTVGTLFAASHVSMRDDYEVSVPEVERLVARAKAHPAVLGARLTGGGFGGAIIALARAGHARDVARAIAVEPGARVLVPRAQNW